MRTAILIVAVAFVLTGCASNSGTTSQLLANLQGCERTYQGNIGGLGFAQGIAVTIRCEPMQGVDEPIRQVSPPEVDE